MWCVLGAFIFGCVSPPVDVPLSVVWINLDILKVRAKWGMKRIHGNVWCLEIAPVVRIIREDYAIATPEILRPFALWNARGDYALSESARLCG